MHTIRRGRDPVRHCATVGDVFRLLQGENPLDVLRCLAEGPADVSTLADTLEIDHSAASHALGKLYRWGLVTARRDCKRHVYRLADAIEAEPGEELVQFAITLPSGAAVCFRTPRVCRAILHRAIVANHANGRATTPTNGQRVPKSLVPNP